MLLDTLRALVYEILKKKNGKRKKVINFFDGFFMFFMKVMSKLF